MPLFRKSASDHAVLSPSHRKVLQRCRMLLLKDLDVQEPLEALGTDEGFRQEIRDQILAQPTRQLRVGAMLDRLETRGEKAFSLFMESLREHHKQLFSVMEEAIRNIDEHDNTKQKERVSFTGEAIRRLLKSSKIRNFSTPDSESADELEVNLDPDEADYIDCYSIPLRGRYCREPWVQHMSGPRCSGSEENDDTSFMAAVTKDLVFRRVQWQDIPKCIRKPPQNCQVYVVDTDQNFFKRDHMLSREEEEEAAEEEQALLRLEDPPPVPPKPEHLPPLATRPPSLRMRKGEFHERSARCRPAGEKPKPLPKPKLPINTSQTVSVSTDDSNSTDSKESSASETTLQPGEDHAVSPTSPPQTPPVPPRTDKTPAPPSLPPLPPTTAPKSPPIPPRQNQARPLSIVSEETRSVDSLHMSHQKEYTPPENVLPHIHERLSNGDSHPNENLYSVERDTEFYGNDKGAEALGNSFIEDEDCEMYEPITSPEDRENLAKSDQVDSSQDSNEKLNGNNSPVVKKLSLAETIAPLAEKEDELLDLPVGADNEEDDLHNLEPTYDEAAGVDRKASADSLTSSSTPASLSTRSTATDSGIDAPATPTMSTAVPLHEVTSSNAGLSLPMRREKRSGSGAPLMLPRNLGDVEIFVDPDTSEDNSYYEDIDAIGAGASSPSAVSNGSYLDPKPFAQALDDHDFRQAWSSLKSSRIARTIDHNWLDPPGRMLLKRSQLLVADVVEACPGLEILTFPQAIPDGEDGPEDTSSCVGGEDDSIKDFHGTHLAYDKYGHAFYLPMQCIRKYGDPEGEPWFYPVEISSQQASLFLGLERQEGCFVVYRPSNQNSGAVYNLSVSRSTGFVVHYHILENVHGDVMVENDEHSFMTIHDLVQYFQKNKGRLVTRLRRPLKEARLPITPGYHYDWKWEVNRSALNMTGQIIGKGHFGYVISGVYQKSPVAVKVLPRQEAGVTEEDDFLEEARMMMSVKNEQIVRLIGVSCLARPLLLISEFCAKGSLRDCLRNGTLPSDNIDTLFDVCIQVTSALAYLECKQYMLHRDVAARNYLLTEDTCVKLADFGRARLVSDNYYQASKNEKIAIKWAAPEILCDSIYTTKADVWSLGCVYWEVFSGGARPYSTLSGEQTAVYVIEGGRLEKPPGCSPDIFAIMRSCWRQNPDDRPSASYLSEKLRSKSSIYYCSPLRPQSTGSSDKISVKSVPPTGPSATSTLKASRPTTPNSKAKKMIYADHKTDEYVKEVVEFREGQSPALRLSAAERLPPSSSETSLVSAAGNSGKDDLHRGHKIRKSLRNFMGKAKRKESKAAADMERPEFRFSHGSTYGN